MIIAFLVGIVCLLFVCVVWLGFKYLDQSELLEESYAEIAHLRKEMGRRWL